MGISEIFAITGGTIQGLSEGRLSEIINDSCKGLDNNAEGRAVAGFCLSCALVSFYRNFERSWQRATVFSMNYDEDGKKNEGNPTEYVIALPNKKLITVPATTALTRDTTFYVGRVIEVKKTVNDEWEPGVLHRFMGNKGLEVMLTGEGSLGNLTVVASELVRIVDQRIIESNKDKAENAKLLFVNDVVWYWTEEAGEKLLGNTALDIASSLCQVLIVSMSKCGNIVDSGLIGALQVAVTALRLSIARYHGEISPKKYWSELSTFTYELARSTVGGMLATGGANAVVYNILTSSLIGFAATSWVVTGTSIAAGIVAFSCGADAAKRLDDQRQLLALSRLCGVHVKCTDAEVASALRFRRRGTHPDARAQEFTGTVTAVYGGYFFRWYDISFCKSDGSKVCTFYLVSNRDPRIISRNGNKVTLQLTGSTQSDILLQDQFAQLIALRLKLKVSEEYFEGYYSPVYFLQRVLKYLRSGLTSDAAEADKLLDNASNIVIDSKEVSKEDWKLVQLATTDTLTDEEVERNVQQRNALSPLMR